jgi:DNA-directed RNA polymerase subunit RPC12/RpoP
MKTTTKKNTSKTPSRNWRGSSWLRPTTRLAIYLRDGCQCAYCGAGIEDTYTTAKGKTKRVQLSADHILPVATARAAGITIDEQDPTNLITACRSCNSRRQDKPVTEWCQILEAQGKIDSAAKTARKISKMTALPIEIEAAKTLLKTHKSVPKTLKAL